MSDAPQTQEGHCNTATAGPSQFLGMAVRFGGYDWITQTRTSNSSFSSEYANDPVLSANSVEEGKPENDRCE
eukprot:4240785-Karenia_brevis.AAC.1